MSTLHESRLDQGLRQLLADCRVAALGTCTEAGEPFVSMVPYALVAAGPWLVLHVSALAAHAAHLRARAPASLLVMQPEQAGAPVHDLARCTLQLQAHVLEPGEQADAHDLALCREAYLDRFPEAEPMTALGDFRFVRLAPLAARHIAGFGAARSLDGEALRAVLRPRAGSYQADAGLRRHAALLQARDAQAPARLISLLELAPRRIQLVVGDGVGPTQVLELPLGLRLLSAGWGEGLPGPAALEAAIADVEEALMRLVPRMPVGSALYGADPLLRRIAALAGAGTGPGASLGLEGVERLFNRLCAVAEGRPVTFEGLPEDRDFAAALVVLRELMHHLSFDALTLAP